MCSIVGVVRKGRKPPRGMIVCATSSWTDLNKAVVHVGPWCQTLGVIRAIIYAIS